MSCWSHYGLKVRRGRFSLTMRILITGGLGFVGGRLAVHLAQPGHQIVLGSRTAITPPDWLPKAAVAQIEWDDARALEHSCKGVDVVIQAAGMSAQDCAADPVAALAFNGVATARLLAAASRAGVQRFIYLSTAHVYASPLVGTITEETCQRNLHPYATSHLAGEHAVLRANQLGKIQGIVLRLSNAFGVPMHKNVNCWMLLVNDLCKQVVQTRTMVLQTSGLQHRDFIGMDEVCRAVEHLAACNAEVLYSGAFNMGVGRSQSVLEMAQFIQQRCRQVLGFDPLLQRPEGGANEQMERLTYRAVALERIGIKIKLDSSAEIDRLLSFCQSSFDRIPSSCA
jgi:UDP-glucose 4-epimerase